jgi:hypothetical protein
MKRTVSTTGASTKLSLFILFVALFPPSIILFSASSGLCPPSTTLFPATANAQEAPQPPKEKFASRRAYFYALKPGVDMRAITRAVGKPDRTHRGQPAYHLDRGFIALTLDGSALLCCEHRDPGGGAISLLLYSSYKGLDPSDAELQRRKELIEKQSFYDIRKWGKQSIYTALHQHGRVFLLRNEYVVLEEVCPLMGESGAFSYSIARATRYRRGKTEVLWRLFDHWPQARPEGLDDAEILRREKVLRELGPAIVGRPIQKTLGRPDGRMGSGEDYRQYYLRDGLITVNVRNNRISSISLTQPGAEKQVGFEAWLKKSRTPR